MSDDTKIEKTLIMTIGLPYSGKSTWAKSTHLPMVNPDSIRLALHGQRFLYEAESMVWSIAEYMVKSLFIAGHHSVILDAMNITRERRKKWRNNNWNIRHVLFLTDYNECIKRAKENNYDNIIPVIEKHKDDILTTVCRLKDEIIDRRIDEVLLVVNNKDNYLFKALATDNNLVLEECEVLKIRNDDESNGIINYYYNLRKNIE